MRILGIDEAGRGPVIGPMAVGAFCIDADRLSDLIATGVNDSKQLSARRREALVPQILALGEGEVRLVTARQIDEGNMNDLEMGVVVDLIRVFHPDLVCIDAPTNPRGIPAWIVAVERQLPFSLDFVVEPKADARYPVVGAASVLAKVRRDHEVSGLGPVGSGYPSDPTTRAWLKGFVDRKEPFPDFVRTRWGTVRDLRAPPLFPEPL